ncbi:MAG: prepilin peptidase [Candidatus Paceibacterota bacterium]|jgi:prepilin signal peptidase PulO-like enzyme (type II secretory pathway)
MNYFILNILIFFFGAAVGSFVNVIVDRLYVKSFISGRSTCHSCSKNLSWYEMIPVLSFLFLKGKCRKCDTKIGPRHLWVEISAGIIGVLTYNLLLFSYFNIYSPNYNLAIGISFALFYVLLFILLFSIFLYDLKHKIVPLGFSILLFVIGLAFEVYRIYNVSFFYGSMHSTLFWLDLFSGVLVALPFLFIYLFSKGKAVGFGDVLLFLSAGYLLGFIFGVSVFLLSIWIGAITSLLLIYLMPHKFNRKSTIPFAPFIIVAVILVIFLHIDVLGLSLILQ